MAESTPADPPLVVIWGEDDFAVQRRARQVFDAWIAARPGGDVEVFDATVPHTEGALQVIGRLREALQTLPFFGGTKVIWLRSCNFLGEDRVSEAQAVVETVAEVGRELAAFDWREVRLLVSAGKLDRRRAFFKTLDRLAGTGTAAIEHFPGLNPDDRDWRLKAESLASGEFRAQAKRIQPEALSCFVEQVGPHARLLASEAQKLCTYVGDRAVIEVADVQAVVVRATQARAFALGDAVGDRDLGRALRHLEEELWAIRADRQKSEIGLLYGLIGKIRAILLAREMIVEGLIRPTRDYSSFVAQLKRLSAERFPADKRYSPLGLNPYILFRAAQQAQRFRADELVAAMEELLAANRRLVSSGLESSLVLQMAILRIVGGQDSAPEESPGSAPAIGRGRPLAGPRPRS